ncbi:MAG: hypothetical protein AB2A00_20230 [Myxococcota bacterium]
MLRILGLAALMMVGACATGSDARMYQEQSRAVAVAQDALLVAVQDNAAAQGWKVVQLDEKRGRVEALAPEDNSEGWVTRERWVFQVTPRELRVRLVLEARLDDGTWWSEGEVCEGYTYLREQQQLENVVGLASRRNLLAQARTVP